MDDIGREYRAARTTAILVDRSAEGRLRVAGRDRLDFLHRMSTNDLRNMGEGEARPTVLTTAIARIVDLVWLLNFDDHLLMFTGPRRAAEVRRWLSKYIFFQDEVVMEDVGGSLGQLGLFGPQAVQAAEALWPGAESLAENRAATAGGLTVIWRGRSLAGDGFTVVAPAEMIPRLKQQAEAAGAVPADEETYQVLRVEAGVPEAGRELTADYIPLEADLWSAVSFSKGCYIGQEIIARMESRGKLAKTLVGLKLSEPIPAGSDIRREGTTIGAVTSAVVSPAVGPIALGYVKTAHATPGTPVVVNGIPGQITSLPFLSR